MVVLTSPRTILASRLGLDEDSPVFLEALTHSSYAAEHQTISNERLEFLGDAVVNFVVAEYLYADEGRIDEGTASLARSRVVNEATLAHVAHGLDVGSAMALGKGETKSGGATRPSLLADAFEALIAAVYLERGFATARTLVLELLHDALVDGLRSPQASDPKSQLRQWAESHGMDAPVYVASVEGPDHRPTYTVTVMLAGEAAATATGHSKKAAEVAAATRAWEERANA